MDYQAPQWPGLVFHGEHTAQVWGTWGFSGMVRASQRPAPTDLEVGSIRGCLRSPIATDGTSASHVPFLGLVHSSVKADHQTKIVVLKLY